MKTHLVVLGLSMAAAVVFMSRGNAASPSSSRMLSHDVYFTLNDRSPAAAERLVGACRKYLADHPGVVGFDAGVLASEFQRDVNDRDFDVSLHLLFKDKASHDAYQSAPKHLQFIAENQDTWKKVRVFDSWVLATGPGVAAEKK